MENQECLCTQASKKTQTPQPTRKILANNGPLFNESLKKGHSLKNSATKEGFRVELLPKSEEPNGKKNKENFSGGAAHRRPCTVSGELRRRPEFGEKERCPSMQTSKSFSVQSRRNSCDSRSVGSASSAPPSIYAKAKKQSLRAKSPGRSKCRIECGQDFESTSMFPEAVYEQGKIIEMLCSARKELRQKMVEKMKAQGEAGAEGGRGSSPGPPGPRSANFENCYSGTLEEIFQAWLNLFYFILNLKVNLIRVLNSAGTESFRPNHEMETEILGQAVECVKFFSRLKIKSLGNSLEELCLPDDRSINEAQIKEYEERVSSPFLFEMDFIQKKAKEILEQAKKREK